jgi:hypothetical protein
MTDHPTSWISWYSLTGARSTCGQVDDTIRELGLTRREVDEQVYAWVSEQIDDALPAGVSLDWEYCESLVCEGEPDRHWEIQEAIRRIAPHDLIADAVQRFRKDTPDQFVREDNIVQLFRGGSGGTTVPTAPAPQPADKPNLGEPRGELICDTCREPIQGPPAAVPGPVTGPPQHQYYCWDCAHAQAVERAANRLLRPRPTAEQEWFNRPFAYDEEGNFLG